MKYLIIGGIIVLVIGLFVPQIVQAQGTTYLSNLGQPSTSSLPVGSDYWLAAFFGTGNNAGGYLLNSVQLGMTDAIGNPSDFTVMIYDVGGIGEGVPESSLVTLSGSANPTTSGIYTYTDDSNIILSPGSYFIVVTAGTTVANGAYSWSESAYPPSINDWGVGNGVLHSSNGISGWTSDPSPYPYSGIAQFAINATAVPEPGVSGLLGLSALGALVFSFHLRKAASKHS